MANSRDREKTWRTALEGNKALFSAAAQKAGHYGGKPYQFCLGGSLPGENLDAGIRKAAME